MAKKARLSDQQKRRAARMAREKGLTCPDCGSSEPVPEDEARAHPLTRRGQIVEAGDLATDQPSLSDEKAEDSLPSNEGRRLLLPTCSRLPDS
jgi:hypothetical protein